ncbi:MAG TPA: hypothetical protein VEQ37_10030, partial [Actinomycetota bacterium]|nr:hypothetical protein [Actinomycetota bacterium]
MDTERAPIYLQDPERAIPPAASEHAGEGVGIPPDRLLRSETCPVPVVEIDQVVPGGELRPGDQSDGLGGLPGPTERAGEDAHRGSNQQAPSGRFGLSAPFLIERRVEVSTEPAFRVQRGTSVPD